ncbi:restriction endonuclease subunit S [Streptococcus mitis]|uniref:restriction endonuclease subunit S n=1 Tax=Streptococcus mitis TaxID=28037 RepID=UPI0021B7E42F|nr:restriction endonuclease subunit S [Streptococcus mitis]
MIKQPSYRFGGYTEPWEEKKLGKVGETKSGVGFPESEQGGVRGIPFYKVSDMNNIGNEIEMVTSNNYVTQEQIDSRKWKVIDTVPAIMFAKVGAALLLNRKRLIREPFLIDNNTMAYIPSAYWDTMFCKILFDTLNLSKYSQVGALPSYNGSDIEAIQVSLPSLPEQTAIGSFFQDIDQLISLQQRKLEVLKEQKKTYLKLLFPVKGQTKPALRFAGFEDEWKRQNFGDYLVEYNEKTVVENQHELLSSTNNGIEPRIGRVSGESNLGYKVLKKDMIVLSPQNLWLGNINYNSNYDLGIVSPSYKIFNIENVDKKFIATLIRHPYMNYEYGQASVQGASVVRRNLDIDLFNGIQIFLPSLEEQSLIGSFFQDLDKAIAKQEEKVNQLKESKQTLLRKMFI